MTALALIFTLACIGISETIYLIRKRITSEKPICILGEDCHIVLTSKYNRLFLIHNDVLGFITYIIISVISAFLAIGVEPIFFWSLILKILVFIASLVSILFTYLQWRVIKAWCFWCLLSALTIWLMGVIIVFSRTL